MNQYQWTFLDDARRRHTLGLAHGPSSGHLVVHCDHRVVLIEFGVVEPRTFSFFIEDELCKLSVLGGVEAGFTYDFNIDTDVDTEVNRRRKERKKKRRLGSALRLSAIVAGIVAVLGATVWWGYNENLNQLPGQLLREGIQAEAQLTPDNELAFVAGPELIIGQPIGRDVDRLAALGLNASSVIPILYAAEHPHRFVVDWRTTLRALNEQAGRNSLARAVDLALTRQLPAEGGEPRCALRAADRLRGLSGQLNLIDAYVLNDGEPRSIWEERFREPAYSARLSQVCPPGEM